MARGERRAEMIEQQVGNSQAVTDLQTQINILMKRVEDIEASKVDEQSDNYQALLGLLL